MQKGHPYKKATTYQRNKNFDNLKQINVKIFLIPFVPPFSLFWIKIFFRQNPHKWHPLIAGSPPAQKFFDLSPPRPSYRHQKFSKKFFFKFFSKNLRKNPFCDFALQAYFLLNFSAPLAPKQK